jgi:hypothetical protein
MIATACFSWDGVNRGVKTIAVQCRQAAVLPYYVSQKYARLVQSSTMFRRTRTAPPHSSFLFGRQEANSQATCQVSVGSISNSQHHRPTPDRQPLQTAFEDSSSREVVASPRTLSKASSLTLLSEPEPVIFAPAMAAPPGGYSSVTTPAWPAISTTDDMLQNQRERP